MPDTDGFYEVSDLGRVRSWLKHGPGSRKRDRPLILRQHASAQGYRIVGNRGQALPEWRVHRLVLHAFVGPCPPGLEGAHLNGDPGDNRLPNLVWVTRKENHSHKILHGTYLRGEKNPNAKLTDRAVLSIRRLWRNGHTQECLAAKYETTQTTVSQIVLRRTWKHI